MALGEQINVVSDELLERLKEEQASTAVSSYPDGSGITDADLRTLRIDFQSAPPRPPRARACR